MEAHFISQYDSFNNGYNMTLGGEGFSSEMATKNLIKRTKNGNNHFSGESGSILSKKVNKQRVNNGTHNFLGGTPRLKLQILNGTFDILREDVVEKKLLGIQLYKFYLRESKTKISCICGSLKFNSLFEASEYHGISMSHLKDRITSKTKKFGNWHISLDDKNFNDYYKNPLKYT